MKKEQLSVTINGAPTNKNAKSVISTVITNKGFNQLSVDFMKGFGHDHREVNEAQVSVWFTEKQGAKKDIWQGSFEELHALLFPAQVAVIYDEDLDGIATTERQLFDNKRDGQAFYNKCVSEGSKEVILTNVIKIQKG